MSLEELSKAVNAERTKLKGFSRIWGLFGLFWFLLSISSFYLHFRWGRFYQEDLIIDTLGILNGITYCYLAFIEIRFLRKLSKRMENGAISSALDLLDHYEEREKTARNYFILFSVISASMFLGWIIGWQKGWWEWSHLAFVGLFLYAVILVIFGILFFTVFRKLAKKAKQRKNIERQVQKYLEDRDSGG